jgi:hypothetical protein
MYLFVFRWGKRIACRFAIIRNKCVGMQQPAQTGVQPPNLDFLWPSDGLPFSTEFDQYQQQINIDRDAALFVEGDILHAACLGLLEVAEAGIAAISGRLPRGHTVTGGMAIEHRQEALGVRRVAGLDDNIEDQAALAGGQVGLVSVLDLAAAFQDDVGVRFEQAS